jgi:drug/metabolite transporter (DMT)-like permease
MNTSSLLGGLTVLVWAIGYPVGALGVAAASPFLLMTLRFALAAVVMALIALVTGAHWPRGRLLAHTAVAGVLVQAVQFGGVYGGLHAGVPAAVASLVIALNPVLTTLLATFMLRERLTWTRSLGLVLGVLAVLAALGDRVLASGFGDAGTMLTLLGLIGFAVGGIYQQRFCREVDVRSGVAVQLAATTPVIGVMAVVESGSVTHWGQAGLVLGWIVVVNSVLGGSLYLALVRRVGAVRTTVLFSVVPPVTGVLAWPMLGQVPSVGVITGIGLGVMACVLGTRPGYVHAKNLRTEVEEQAVGT